MKNYTFNANMFIIPNGIHTSNGCCYEMNRRSVNARFEELGIDYHIESGEKLVQIWSCGCDSDNWSDHHLPYEIRELLGFNEDDGFVRFHDLLPVSWFTGKKEGDIVTVNFTKNDVTVTVNFKLSQLDYRYRRFGKFEEVFNDLMARAA